MPREPREEVIAGEARPKLDLSRAIVIKHGHLHPAVKREVKRVIRKVVDKAFAKERGTVWTSSLVVFRRKPYRLDSELVGIIRKHGLLSPAHADKYRLPNIAELADTHHNLTVRLNGDIHLNPH